MKFDIDQFTKMDGTIHYEDEHQITKLTIPIDTNHILVGMQNVKTKEWLWIRKDFRKEDNKNKNAR